MHEAGEAITWKNREGTRDIEPKKENENEKRVQKIAFYRIKEIESRNTTICEGEGLRILG